MERQCLKDQRRTIAIWRAGVETDTRENRYQKRNSSASMDEREGTYGDAEVVSVGGGMVKR